MKLMINGFEVEVKAKSLYSEKYNKMDTFYLLNNIAIWMAEAWHRYEQIGANALAEESKNEFMKLHDFLENKGFYKNL